LTWTLEYPLVTFRTLRITLDMVGGFQRVAWGEILGSGWRGDGEVLALAPRGPGSTRSTRRRQRLDPTDDGFDCPVATGNGGRLDRRREDDRPGDESRRRADGTGACGTDI